MPKFTVHFSWYTDIDIFADNEGEAIAKARRCLPVGKGAPDEIECQEWEEESEEEE